MICFLYFEKVIKNDTYSKYESEINSVVLFTTCALQLLNKVKVLTKAWPPHLGWPFRASVGAHRYIAATVSIHVSILSFPSSSSSSSHIVYS